MKKSLFTLILMLWFGNQYSQTLEGRILDASSGEPVANVAIQVLDASTGTVSAQDGYFALSVPGFPVRLQFSTLGFETKLITFRSTEEDRVVYLTPAAESLSEVVLRSTIIPREVLRTPASVSVLDNEDFERNDETTIVQAMNRVSGLYVHQGALNTNKMSIRGIGARSQYSTNRVKAYFEEIPISTAEGETTLDDIDPSVIGRAEIIKGPVSSIYGAGLGGVINLYAVRPNEMGTGAREKAIFGSYGLFKNTLQASYASENSGLVATYNHLKSDGWRENGAYERNSFTVNGNVSGGERNNLTVLAQFTRLMAYIPSSVNRETLDNDPASAAFTWAAAQGYESYDKGLFGISNRHNFSENFSNTTSLYMNFRNAYEPRPFDILKEEQVATGARTKFNAEIALFGSPAEVSFGAEIYQEWYDTATFENLYESFPGEGSVAGNSLSNNDQNRSYYNLFAQYNVSFSEDFSLEAGVNFNSTSYELTDLYTEDEVDQSGEYRFSNIFSPRLGLVYSLASGKNLYASVSHGFSTPTVAETLTPEGLINTNLEPETGINYEVGFKGNFLENRLYTEIALFSIQVENLLVAERVGEDQYIGRNAGKTDHNGLEFLLNYNFPIMNGIRGQSFVNGSFNNFTFDEFVDDNEDFSGNDLPAVPDKSIAAGLDFISDSGITLRATYEHEGEMALNDENSLYTDNYNLFHLKASYAPKLFQNWTTELFGGVNNIFDEKYAASIIPNSVGFGGSAPRYFYPGMPRNWFAGVSIELSIND